jgi:hypothetical protein
MPVTERFYVGTRWVVAAGPVEYMGLIVRVTGEVYDHDGDLWVEVESSHSSRFHASLSWLS